MLDEPPENSGRSNRDIEESRIVTRWFSRLEDYVGADRRPVFQNGLHAAGITESQLNDGSVLLKQQHLDAALATIRADIPDVTLRLFSRAEILDLGLVGYAAINSDSIGDAIRLLNQYHSLASDRYTDEVSIDGSLARINPIPFPMYADEYQDICEDSFSGNWQALRLLLGPTADVRKISLRLNYRTPDYLATYEEIFGSNCYFNEPATGLYFPAEWLDRPVHRGSGALSDAYQAMCERILGPPAENKDTTLQVRRLLLSRAGKHIPSLDEAATALRLTETQLRKRLYRSGTTYKKLVLEIRMELGRHYLIDTELTVQEIAYLLDYATPAPFSRAFKRFYGVAPAYYRQTSASATSS